MKYIGCLKKVIQTLCALLVDMIEELKFERLVNEDGKIGQQLGCLGNYCYDVEQPTRTASHLFATFRSITENSSSFENVHCVC